MKLRFDCIVKLVPSFLIVVLLNIGRQSMVKTSTVLSAISGLLLGGLGAVSHANAAVLFKIDPNPSATDMLNLSEAHGVTTDAASVDGMAVAINANVSSDFAGGAANIKPAGTALLTDLTFTPANPNLFDDFSFRGQDLVANQVITLKVTDQFGVTESFDFTQGNANQDFARQGIEAATAGETIASIELINSGGFKEAKQFAFGLAPGVVVGGGAGGIPEPASWALMLLGAGLIGGTLRASRRTAHVRN